jgi:hypothetical protein
LADLLAYSGLTSCKKEEEAPRVEVQAPAAETPKEEMSRKDITHRQRTNAMKNKMEICKKKII